MRYLGVDFGSKKVGLALSDEAGKFAMPHSVVVNDQNLIKTVAQVCVAEKVGEIVIGKSVDYKNQPNAILAVSEKFGQELKKQTNLNINWEPEFLTSKLAEREIGRDDMYDARAAALILQSYLDRLRS